MAIAQPLRRGSDEIDFLKSRAKSPPLGAALVRQKAADLAQRALASDGYLGGEAHDQGTHLIELYMQHADVALGYPSFRAFLEERWPLDVSVAYERMRIGRLCTHDQAAKHGASVCVLGLRVMSALGTDDFEAFLQRPLRLHREDGGGTVRFPAPARQLRSVLRQLATRAAEGNAGDVTFRFRRSREIVDELIAKDPQVAAIKPTVWADAKGVYVRVTAEGPSQSGAAVRLYQRLAKLPAGE